LEDLAFPYVHPEEYLKTVEVTQNQIKENKNYLEKIKPRVEQILKENNINATTVTARSNIFIAYGKNSKSTILIWRWSTIWWL
jgi:(p)ppGpp synthase/HD superfamily hydrolase